MFEEVINNDILDRIWCWGWHDKFSDFIQLQLYPSRPANSDLTYIIQFDLDITETDN
jgi:hypothetical protein